VAKAIYPSKINQRAFLKMPSSQPYQPLLLRILHGLTGLSTLLAILTAAWTFDTYDARWINLPWPHLPAIEGIHGTFGLYALLLFPLLVVYSFRQGYRRLAQSDVVVTLVQKSPSHPRWWYALHRCANTLMLLALTGSLFSGKMMSSEWLPKGELNHFWYYGHLVGWLILVVSLSIHLLMVIKVGGVPLLLSMLTWRFRKVDHPRHWPVHIASTGQSLQLKTVKGWLHWAKTLKLMEASILVILVAGWVIPLFKH
jgi:hypothetical protein